MSGFCGGGYEMDTEESPRLSIQGDQQGNPKRRSDQRSDESSQGSDHSLEV